MLEARVDGGDRLAQSFHDAARDLEDMPDAGDQAGALVAGVVRHETPVKTGALLHTVDVAVHGSLVEITAGGDGVTYAGAVHARNPFMSRAAKATVDDVLSVYQRHVEKALNQIEGT